MDEFFRLVIIGASVLSVLGPIVWIIIAAFFVKKVSQSSIAGRAAYSTADLRQLDVLFRRLEQMATHGHAV